MPNAPSPLRPTGQPQLPLVLFLAGCGTYHSPFFLDPNDVMVRPARAGAAPPPPPPPPPPLVQSA